jgi:hypothetical protein
MWKYTYLCICTVMLRARMCTHPNRHTCLHNKINPIYKTQTSSASTQTRTTHLQTTPMHTRTCLSPLHDALNACACRCLIHAYRCARTCIHACMHTCAWCSVYTSIHVPMHTHIHNHLNKHTHTYTSKASNHTSSMARVMCKATTKHPSLSHVSAGLWACTC